MSRVGEFGARLYRGEVSYDFVSRRRTWYAISAVVLLISLGSLFTRELTLGIEFRGGAEFRVASSSVSEDAVLDTVQGITGGQVTVQRIGDNSVRAQTEKLDESQVREVQSALAEEFGVSRDDVSTQFIGPSWGEDISKKALRALVIFLLLVVIFLSLYFEWKMALSAMVALLHDLLITVGIYSLIGFEVTPATVIGFLTILGYSLYDTVVVFDKVKENTQGITGGSRMTYGESANLAVNQTLVRSINTSIIALLPIGAILFAGTVLLGAGPLKDLALALFVGVAAGTYSSVFIATPLLAALKDKEPEMQSLARRVQARRAGGGQRATTSRTAARGGAGTSGTATSTLERDVTEPPPAAPDGESVAGPPPAREPGKRPPPRRTGSGSQRKQPKKSKNRPGGKKRR